MDGAGPKTTAYPTQSAPPSLDRAIGDRATLQHGVIALAQLVDLGLRPSSIRDRVASGRLRRIHRGVYAVGHTALPPLGRVMAAVLACGPEAAASHRTAAALLGLRRSSRTAIDVTAPRGRGRSIDGIDAHRSKSLRPCDVVVVDGIPCTSVARTLLDLAAVVDRRGLERACDQAEILQLFDLRTIEDVLARAHGHPGAGPLRAVLRGHAIGTTPTRNELEERFLAVCDRHPIARPAVNAHVAVPGTDGFTPDFVWHEARLVVETDGRETHATRRAFEEDRRRDALLALAGWRVVRFTWQQVLDDPDHVARVVRGLLARRAIG